jgi:hypothetical protein
MQTITAIGLDIAKSVFQVHDVDAGGQVIVRRQLKRRQRSYEPRQKAGHMAAPTNAAKREKSPCQPVHTWPKPDVEGLHEATSSGILAAA